MELDEFKNCPLCGNQIRAAAIKCRHCGAWLDSNQEVPAKPANQNPRTGLKAEDAAESDTLPTVPVKRVNYFVRHWRGELSLGVSYWANGLLATIFVLVADKSLARLQDSTGYKLLALSCVLFYATAIVASVWQLVGIWRSASNYVSRGGKTIWAALAKVAVIFSALSCLALVVKTYIPQTVEMVIIITGDKKLPPYIIRVLPGGTEVEFRGGLRAGCAKELERILVAVPQAKVLHINSAGGRIREAKVIMQLVRERSLTTYTSEQCLSAATLVLMSGKERVVAAGAKVGFHAGALPGVTVEQQREMDDLVRRAMQSAGVSEEFIIRVLATPSEQMWYPSAKEMRLAGVVTSQSYGDRFANSWSLSITKSDAALQKEFSELPFFGTIRELEPEAYAKMITDVTAAIRSGKSEAEALAAVSQVAAGLVEKYLPAASDEALLALRDQWIWILRRYKDKNSQGCIAAFTHAKINYARVFPDWNMMNMLSVCEQAMRSGASGVTVPVDKKAVSEDLESIFELLADKYGNDVLLLENQDQWMANSQKVCDLLLAEYKQTEALPVKRAANLIRYFVTSKD